MLLNMDNLKEKRLTIFLRIPMWEFLNVDLWKFLYINHESSRVRFSVLRYFAIPFWLIFIDLL